MPVEFLTAEQSQHYGRYTRTGGRDRSPMGGGRSYLMAGKRMANPRDSWWSGRHAHTH